MQEDGEHPSERVSDSSSSDILPPPQSDPDVEVTENWVIDADKLHLGKEIGKGAFGTVYKGKFITTPVAIKKLHHSEDSVIKDFLHEVQIMKTLRHPNIVLWMGIHHNTQTQELSIVTEFVPNGTLHSLLIHHDKPCPWVTRVRMALEIANALGYLHAKNILHRDLKSENVLLGQSWDCKVADFGLAVLHDHNAKLSAVGDPWWRAPEVDKYEYGPAADIFSFGIVLGELITRSDGETIRLTMTYQKKGKLEFGVNSEKLRELVGDDCSQGCPTALISLAIACCNEDPDKRPTLNEIVAKLAKLQKDLLELDKALNEIIHDDKGAEQGRTLFCSLATKDVGLWKEGEGPKIDTADLLAALSKMLKESTDRELTREEVQNIRSMIANKGSDGVTMQCFADFWVWFSATYRLIMDTRLAGLWNVHFIHGFISRVETEKLLLEQNKGKTVIFRFSSTQPGALVLSYLWHDDEEVVRHDLIEVSDSGFITKSGHQRPTLKKVLTDTESEYADLEFIYPQLPFEMVGFYSHLSADPQDGAAASGYNVPAPAKKKGKD